MFKTLTLAAAILLFFTEPWKRQESCNLDVSQAPAVLGLKLGMPGSELPAVFAPAIKIKPSKKSEGSLFLSFAERPATGDFKGVRALYVRYFKGRVYQIEIFYENDSQTTKLEDLIDRLSNELGLPATAWNTKNGRATIDCGGFTLTADAILNPHIELTDVAGFQAFQEQSKQPKKRRRKPATKATGL